MINIAKILDTTNLSYETDEDGDHSIVVEFDDDRSQLVYVSGSTETTESGEVLQIWSAGSDSIADLPTNMFKKLLQFNAQQIIGAWEINDDSLSFSIKLPIDKNNFRPELLEDMISICASVADEFEEENCGDDDL